MILTPRLLQLILGLIVESIKDKELTDPTTNELFDFTVIQLKKRK